LVLAPEHVRDLSGEAAEDLATRVDHPPHALLRRSRRRGGGIHKLTRRSRQSHAMLEGDRKSVKRGGTSMRSSMPRSSGLKGTPSDHYAVGQSRFGTGREGWNE